MNRTPRGWHQAALGDVCQVVSGATPKTGVPQYWGGEIRWLTPADMSADRSQTLCGGSRTLTWLGYDSCSARLVPPGSVVVSSRAPVGYVAIVGAALATNQGCKTAVPPDYIDSNYLYWYLTASRRDLESRASGTTFKEISAKEFGRTVFRWPELDEQWRIVDILDDHLSRLDAANDYLDKVTTRLQSLRVARWRSTFERLAESSAVRPLLEVARIENGQTPRGLAEALLPGPSTESVPFYKVGDMNAGDGQAMSTARFHVSRSAAERLGLHLRRPGCVLIPKRGGAINTNKKRLLNTEAAFDLNTMGLRPTDAVRQQYLWHWLDGIDLGAIADGSNVPQINAPQIRRLSLPVPSLDVQDRTCDELDIFMSQRLAAGEEVRRSRERAVTLRAALLRSAFSGRLTGRSSGLDRAEEMASA